MPINIEETAEGIAIRQLEERLRNTAPFLAGVGAILVGTSQKAFREQKFGGIPWAPRYENQNGAKLNIAGSLADAEAGRPAPKPNRFNDRPAAVDTGALKNSISFRVEGEAVYVGSQLPYAQVQHAGGVTVQRITDAMRHTIAGWLRKARRAVKRAKAAATFKAKPFDRMTALSRLTFVFFKRGGSYLVPEKKTTVQARPFVGVTDEARKKIIRFGEDWFSGRAK